MARVPGIMPTPVEHLGENQLVLTRQETEFDFALHVGHCGHFVPTAMEAIVSGIAISQSVATTGTLNKLSGEVASALSSQNNINSLVQVGTLRLMRPGCLPYTETPS